MKITSTHVWVGRRRTTGRDELSQIASFDEQSALNCVFPPIFLPLEHFNLHTIFFFFPVLYLYELPT